MMRLTAFLCGLLLLATPVGAVAQAPPGLPADPDAVLVEELVVTAREIGPAWWRVSDADSTVYVMGVPSVIPKGSGWDPSVLERRLEGANLVILPFNNASVNLLTAPGAVVSLVRLRSSASFEETLEGPLKARFVAARTRAGQEAERYKTRNGMAAALLLVSDYRDAARLTARAQPFEGVVGTRTRGGGAARIENAQGRRIEVSCQNIAALCSGDLTGQLLSLRVVKVTTLGEHLAVSARQGDRVLFDPQQLPLAVQRYRSGHRTRIALLLLGLAGLVVYLRFKSRGRAESD